MEYTYRQKQIRKKLNGYRCSHRNKWLLLSFHILSLQSLVLLEFYVDIFDFDVKHDTFGTFRANFAEIAEFLGFSVSSIRAWHKELLVNGFVSPTDQKGVYTLTNAKRYISPGFWKGDAAYYSTFEKNQPVEAIVQLMKQNVQPNTAVSALSPQVEVPRALVSSKSDLSKVSGMSKDDEEWINSHLRKDEND